MPKTDTPSTRRSARLANSEPISQISRPVKKTKVEDEEVKVKAQSKTKAKPESKAKAETKPASKASDSSARGQLKLGSVLPKITVLNDAGEDVDVSTLAADKGVVVFLYPRADTPGCTNQACGYRDLHDEIAELGYDIYGLSKDKPAAQAKWIKKKNLNYRLLCDPESKFIKKLGAFIPPNNTKRSHFIFEKGTGKLLDIALGVKPADDPGNVLKFIKAQ